MIELALAGPAGGGASLLEVVGLTFHDSGPPSVRPSLPPDTAPALGGLRCQVRVPKPSTKIAQLRHYIPEGVPTRPAEATTSPK